MPGEGLGAPGRPVSGAGGGRPRERGVGSCPWARGAFLGASDGVCFLPRSPREAAAVSLHLSVCSFPARSLG